ncbi:hypothetical protein [Alkalicoccobacillus gibsonii]|uniref:hypothetical protein n=1 Tax=Alkalicoccobacillus gibsonii TaxID=79881 RepID=UPI003512375C
MKRLYLAIILLLTSFIYVIHKVTQEKLYLKKFSFNAENPVKLDWGSIRIDTGFMENSSDSYYYIWMTPVYFLILLAIILTLTTFFKRT